MPTNIPILASPRNQVGPVRNVEQSHGQTAGAFGELEAANTLRGAKQLEGTGSELMQNALSIKTAEDKIKAREDSLRSITILNEVDAKARERLLAYQAGGNLANPDQVRELRTELGKIQSEALTKFGAGQLPTSALDFQRDLTAAFGQLNAHLTEEGIKAGKAALNNESLKVVNQLTSMALNTPEAVPDILNNFNQFVEKRLAPGLDPVETDNIRRAGLETIAVGALQPIIARGDYDLALQKLAADPTFKDNISASKQIDLRMNIWAGIAKRNELSGKIAAAETIMKSEGFSDIDRRRVIGGMLGGFDLDAANQKAAASAGPFHNKENAMKYLLVNAPRIESGKASMEEVMLYMTTAEFIATKDQLGNSLPIPTVAKAALKVYNLDISEAGTNASTAATTMATLRKLMQAGGPAAIAGDPQNQTPAGVGADNRGRAADQKKASQDNVLNMITSSTQFGTGVLKGIEESVGKDLTGKPDPDQHAQKLIDTGVVLYEVTDYLTGILSTAAKSLASNELTGLFVDAPQTVYLRNAFGSLKGLIESSLRFTERYGSAEKGDIQKKLSDLDPSFFSSPSAMQDAMRGLDSTLASLVEGYEKAVKEGQLGKEERNNLLLDIQRLKMARQVMGVPMTVLDRSHLKKLVQEGTLKPGMSYYWAGRGEKGVYIFNNDGAQPKEGQ